MHVSIKSREMPMPVQLQATLYSSRPQSASGLLPLALVERPRPMLRRRHAGGVV